MTQVQLNTVSLNAAELSIIRILLFEYASLEREDLVGLILKRTGHTVLSDVEIVALATKLGGQ